MFIFGTKEIAQLQPGGTEPGRKWLPQWRLTCAAYMVTWRLDGALPVLTDAEKDLVVNSLRHFHADRYLLYAYAVMDDHVHAVLRPMGEHSLGKVLHTLKSYTAHCLNKQRARVGTCWQKDSYTRIIRSDEDLVEKMLYVLNNPLKEYGCSKEYKWTGWNWD